MCFSKRKPSRYPTRAVVCGPECDPIRLLAGFLPEGGIVTSVTGPRSSLPARQGQSGISASRNAQGKKLSLPFFGETEAFLRCQKSARSSPRSSQGRKTPKGKKEGDGSPPHATSLEFFMSTIRGGPLHQRSGRKKKSRTR